MTAQMAQLNCCRVVGAEQQEMRRDISCRQSGRVCNQLFCALVVVVPEWLLYLLNFSALSAVCSVGSGFCFQFCLSLSSLSRTFFMLAALCSPIFSAGT